MDATLLQTFHREIELQCVFMLLAHNDLRASLLTGDNARAFYNIQNILTAAANTAKALWGHAATTAQERQALRESVVVSDDSPFHDVAMRQNFDHVDDRIDAWWKTSSSHTQMDLNIAPRLASAQIDEIDRFRNFDPSTGDLTLWSEDFNVDALVVEAERILLIVAQARAHRSERAEPAGDAGPPGGRL